MKRGVFIIVLLAILVAIGAFSFGGDKEETTQESLTEAATYFKTELENRFITQVGQPIEGFEPAMFMQIYPNLIVEDFGGVEAIQGEYQVSSGALAFIFTDSGPEHSAARAITEMGMGVLLENVAARLALPFETNEHIDTILEALGGAQVTETDVEEYIVGSWRSMDDNLFTREFEADGMVTDFYEGDDSATSIGEWEIFVDPQNEPVPIPEIEGATYLKILFNEEVLYYTVSEANEQSLQLIFLDRGGALNFTRI